MLIVLYILFFVLILFLFADSQKRQIVDVIPVVFSTFVLQLYILAFFNKMWLSDYIISFGILFEILVLCKKKLLGKFLLQLIEPSFLIFSIVVITGMTLLSSRGISTFDEWHFWAVDIKSIFSLQGYAAKGFNCAPSFGDYPPPRSNSSLPGSCTFPGEFLKELSCQVIFWQCRYIWLLCFLKSPNSASYIAEA